jgi:excisionase family DNA binding protein
VAVSDADDTQPSAPDLSAPLLRPSDVAELLAVRPSWVYEAVRDNRMPCLRIGRRIRFTREMLERWVAEQRVDPGSPGRV